MSKKYLKEINKIISKQTIKKTFLKLPQNNTKKQPVLTQEDCDLVVGEEKRHLLLLDLENIEAALNLEQFMMTDLRIQKT